MMGLPLLAAPVVAACQRLVPRTAGPATRAKAPPFVLAGHDGKSHALAKLIERKPAVVVFYRGFW